MNDSYLIPANVKRGQLILGLFKPFDLIIFGSGLMVTFILFLFFPIDKAWAAGIAVSPAIVCSLLVFPMPNYHNVRTALGEMYLFLTERQKFVWKGWCFRDGEDK